MKNDATRRTARVSLGGRSSASSELPLRGHQSPGPSSSRRIRPVPHRIANKNQLLLQRRERGRTLARRPASARRASCDNGCLMQVCEKLLQQRIICGDFVADGNSVAGGAEATPSTSKSPQTLRYSGQYSFAHLYAATVQWIGFEGSDSSSPRTRGTVQASATSS